MGTGERRLGALISRTVGHGWIEERCVRGTEAPGRTVAVYLDLEPDQERTGVPVSSRQALP